MDIKSIAVIGVGTMGTLLTRWALERGLTVSVYDSRDGALEKLGKATQALEDRSSRLNVTTDLEKAGAHAQLVFESIPDEIASKTEALRMLDDLCPRETILASCSATIPVTLLEESLRKRDRFLVANFWFDTPLVEVMRGRGTDERTIDAVMQFCGHLQKHLILLTKDCPGHVCCRMFLGQVCRALRILEAGVASAEDIDVCMTLGSGYASGIMHRCDRMGLDFVWQSFRTMHELTGEERFRPNQVLDERVKSGKLGEKTGEGFFRWPGP